MSNHPSVHRRYSLIAKITLDRVVLMILFKEELWIQLREVIQWTMWTRLCTFQAATLSIAQDALVLCVIMIYSMCKLSILVRILRLHSRLVSLLSLNINYFIPRKLFSAGIQMKSFPKKLLYPAEPPSLSF